MLSPDRDNLIPRVLFIRIIMKAGIQSPMNAFIPVCKSHARVRKKTGIQKTIMFLLKPDHALNGCKKRTTNSACPLSEISLLPISQHNKMLSIHHSSGQIFFGYSMNL